MRRRGVSQAEAQLLRVGRLVEGLPADLRDIAFGLVVPAMLEWHPERCGVCRGSLPDERIACVEPDGDTLRIRMLHRACAEAERAAEGYRERLAN